VLNLICHDRAYMHSPKQRLSNHICNSSTTVADGLLLSEIFNYCIGLIATKLYKLDFPEMNLSHLLNYHKMSTFTFFKLCQMEPGCYKLLINPHCCTQYAMIAIRQS